MIYPMKMDMIILAFSAILPLILLAVRRALLSTKLNLRRISGQSTTASCGKTDNRKSLRKRFFGSKEVAAPAAESQVYIHCGIHK